MRIGWLLSLLSTVIAAVSAAAVPGKSFDRVVIIIHENQDYAKVAKDPYFSSIAKNHNGIVTTNYLALTHPSQPNYIGMISGSMSSVFLDFDSDIDRKSIVDLLEAKGVSWKAYMESYPGNCSSGTKYDTYRRKHNPFISIDNIRNNATRCANIVPATQLDEDIANDDVPQFVFYTPDMNNDGHDTSLAYSSNWTQTWLEPRLKEPAFTKNTLFILTWDEAENYLAKNQIYTVLFGDVIKRSSQTDGVRYDHYSILKTIEDNWDLGNLGENDVDATPFILKDQAENGASAKIKNVVVLMMENRSFDRMMGWFKYNDEIDGLTGKEFNYVDPTNTSSPKVYATNQGLLKDPLDPNHSYQNVTWQISGNSKLASNAPIKNATMGGFVASLAATYPEIANNLTALRQAMDGFDPATIPITYELASNYTILNRYFSSFPGSTMPNRLFLHSATSAGEVNTDGSHYILGYSQRTIYQNLEDAGYTWRNYYQIISSLLVFNKLRLSALDNYKNWATFKEDAANGNLPDVAFIDPAYFSIPRCIPENDMHPPSDVAEGEALIKEVYETIRASPQWNNTLLIINFDEHGGYFDHVPPPSKGVPNPDGINASDFNFDRLGVRVPAILISPWVEKGGVIGEPNGPTETSQYEHSSVPATIKKLFNLPNFLTKRDAWAATFEHAISLDSPRDDCPTKLSDAPAPATNYTPDNAIEDALCDAFKKILQGESN
ncbi:hypothetical protein VTP01DRAFT_537 [Rhizomucor pusillus]|uniref:uncharacterized protein n=1 Tax=Rhizomucor pusillus TaxID=4840 RepID=UPI003743352B